jgi:GT2 family glycosyltransferase
MISVVIPTCHRAEILARCLERLAPGRQEGMTQGQSYEVIVSDAGVREQAAALLGGRFPWVRWAEARGCGPGPNRNVGAKSARGEWLAFTDDDCLPEPRWLACLAARAAAGDVDVIEGAILSPTLPDHPLWTAPVNTSGNAGWTANLCVRRALFEKLGGFDPDLVETAEDMEFHFRSRRAGARWVFVREAAVEHPPRRMTWAQMWRETLRFRWWFMYRLKVGWGPGPEAGGLRSLADVIGSLAKLHARTTWTLLRELAGGKTAHVRRDLFLRARDWLLFPVLVPYFWRCAVGYRKQLRARNA